MLIVEKPYVIVAKTMFCFSLNKRNSGQQSRTDTVGPCYHVGSMF